MTKIIAMLAKRLAVLSGPVLAWAAVAIIAVCVTLLATIGAYATVTALLTAVIGLYQYNRHQDDKN